MSASDDQRMLAEQVGAWRQLQEALKRLVVAGASDIESDLARMVASHLRRAGEQIAAAKVLASVVRPLQIPTMDSASLDDVVRKALTLASWLDDEGYRVSERSFREASSLLRVVESHVLELSTSVTSQGQASSNESQPSRRAKRTEADKLRDEGQIAGYIAEHPDTTRDEIAQATGIACAHVSSSQAWKSHKAGKSEAARARRPVSVKNIDDL